MKYNIIRIIFCTLLGYLANISRIVVVKVTTKTQTGSLVLVVIGGSRSSRR